MSRRYFDVYWKGADSGTFQFGDYVDSFDVPEVWSKKTVRSMVAAQLRELKQPAETSDLRVVRISQADYNWEG